MFPSLLIELELYAIVVGLSVGLFVFLARERLRKQKGNPGAGGKPVVEAMQNPFRRADTTF